MAEIGRQGGERREKRGVREERQRGGKSEKDRDTGGQRQGEEGKREIMNEVLLNHRHRNSGRACRRPVLNAEISPQPWSQESWV